MDIRRARKLTPRAPALGRGFGHPALPVDVVSADVVRSRVAAIISPSGSGLHEEGGLLVREVNDELSHVLAVLEIEDALYTLQWGVRLSYLPPADGPFALYDTVFDYVLTCSRDFAGARRYMISGRHGLTGVDHDTERVWHRLRPIVRAWWASCETSRDVAERADRQAARLWIGPRHTPDPARVAETARAHFERD